MQIACMLPVILIGRELEGGCTSFHEFAPFRHGLYPCMVSPYFLKDKTPLQTSGRRLFFVETLLRSRGRRFFYADEYCLS